MGNDKKTSDYVEKATTCHKGRYLYEKAIYTGSNEKLIITCRIHGDFSMRAGAHIGSQRQGCKACGGRPNVTTDDFVRKAKEKHGEKYNYEKTEYENVKTKVLVSCRIHGDISILPGNHLLGAGGCKICGGRPDITTEEYINRLESVFGDDYDYSLVNYKGAFEKVKIICRVHGEFERPAYTFARSDGCPKCLKFTMVDFLKKAAEVHGDKYSYSDVNYINTKTKISIKCPDHGFFEQTPNRHLDGRGCPVCGVFSNILANRSPSDPCLLYYLKLNYKGHFFTKLA